MWPSVVFNHELTSMTSKKKKKSRTNINISQLNITVSVDEFQKLLNINKNRYLCTETLGDIPPRY